MGKMPVCLISNKIHKTAADTNFYTEVGKSLVPIEKVGLALLL